MPSLFLGNLFPVRNISDVYSFTDSENEEYMFPNERKQVAENPKQSTSKLSTSSKNTIIIKDLLLK
jgi:hypothetical protein